MHFTLLTILPFFKPSALQLQSYHLPLIFPHITLSTCKVPSSGSLFLHLNVSLAFIFWWFFPLIINIYPHLLILFISSASVQFTRSVVSDTATPWTAARQTSLSITNSRSPPKPTFIESMMSSSRLILRHPLLLLPSIFPSIRVFFKEAALHIRWPKYWSFRFNIRSSNERIQDGSPLGWTAWISLQSKGFSRVLSNTTVQKHQFFSTQPSL